MLTKGFSTPILIAFFIAGPGVFLLMQYWLNKFAYKVGVDIGLIAWSGFLAWAKAFVFIGFSIVESSADEPDGKFEGRVKVYYAIHVPNTCIH